MTMWQMNRTKWKSMCWPQSILANTIYKKSSAGKMEKSYKFLPDFSQ